MQASNWSKRKLQHTEVFCTAWGERSGKGAVSDGGFALWSVSRTTVILVKAFCFLRSYLWWKLKCFEEVLHHLDKKNLKTSSPLNNSGGGWHAPVLHWLWVSKNIMLFHCAFEVTNTFPDEWCQMSHLPKQNVYNSNVVPQMSQPQKNLNDLKHYIQQSLQTMIHFKIIQVPFLFWSPLEATSIFLASFLKKPAMPPATWTDGCHGLSSSEEWWLLKCESAPMLLPDKPALDIWEAELPAPELPERVEFAWERHQSK